MRLWRCVHFHCIRNKGAFGGAPFFLVVPFWCRCSFAIVLGVFFFLCLGLTLFGLGEGLLIVSFAGASPWSVLAQGIALHVDFSTGIITIFVSIGVLLLLLPLN